MVKPKLEVDRVCDAAYLRITKKKAALTKVLKGGVIVDYDKNGWLVGIEFLNLETLTHILNTMEVHDDSSEPSH